MLNYKNWGRLWKVYGRSFLRYGTPKKILNALRTELAYRRRKVDVRTPPYILMLEPLYYCNLACPLCDRQVFPGVRQGKEAGYLPLEMVDKVLHEIGDYLFQCQIFGQGEPLMHWRLTREIIERFHRRRVFTLLSSNMTLVTEKIAEEAVTSGLDHWVAAIDGVSQEAYEQYRQGRVSNVEKCFEGLRQLIEARRRHKSRMTIEWQYLFHKGNVHEIERARSMAEELGIWFRPSPLRGMEFDSRLQKQWLPNDEAYRVAGTAKEGETINDFPCYFLWRALTLNSNTQLARCLIYQNVSEFGSLRDHSVMDLYNSPSQQAARALFNKGEPHTEGFPAPCHNCSFFERHHGGPNMDKFGSLGLESEDAADYTYAAEPEIPLTVLPAQTTE